MPPVGVAVKSASRGEPGKDDKGRMMVDVSLLAPFWLSLGGLLVHWIAGNKHKAAWLVGIALQGQWTAYAVVTRQWGFIMSAMVYAGIYARNYRRWALEEKRKAVLDLTLTKIRESEESDHG
jgi:hypothetical protein